MDCSRPRPRARSATRRMHNTTARRHREAYVYDGYLYIPDPEGGAPTRHGEVRLIHDRPNRRDWLGPCNVLRPQTWPIYPPSHSEGSHVPHKSLGPAALDTALTHLASAAARLHRCGPAFADASEQLWYFASGSWTWERWEAAMGNRAKVGGKGGLVAELGKARRECQRALRVLEEDGDGEYDSDAEDLRELLGGLGIGL